MRRSFPLDGHFWQQSSAVLVIFHSDISAIWESHWERSGPSWIKSSFWQSSISGVVDVSRSVSEACFVGLRLLLQYSTRRMSEYPLYEPICAFLLVIQLHFYLAPFPSYGWLYVKFSLTTRGRYTLTPSLEWSPANIAISDIPLKTRFFRLHFTRRMYRCIFNHFYVIGPKSYRIRRSNANYTAITPFKVIQGHRFLYQSKAHATSY